jgi:hypothetical protein
MYDQCRAEIEDLHNFFVAWFNGHLPQTDAAFARFADVMAPGFTIVDPSGTIQDRESLLAGLHAAHNARPGIRIWIESVRIRQHTDDLIVATYEEWQQLPDQSPRGRISTVILRAADNTPNGLVWLHVHETWLPV